MGVEARSWATAGQRGLSLMAMVDGMYSVRDSRDVATAFMLGEIQGQVRLSDEVAEGARALAAEVYARLQAEEFSGDQVQDELPPAWLAGWREWFPLQALAALGLRPVEERFRVYATASVDEHVDDMDGLCLILVLFNDGLEFQTVGGVRHRTPAGAWFVLDDRLPHEVVEGRDSTVYLCVSLALECDKSASGQPR